MKVYLVFWRDGQGHHGLTDVLASRKAAEVRVGERAIEKMSTPGIEFYIVEYDVEGAVEPVELPDDDTPRLRPRTRYERLQAAADAGFDTWEDYRGEK